MNQTAGGRNSGRADALDDAEHDRAHEREGNIGGHNAQFADESHRKPPWFTSLPA